MTHADLILGIETTCDDTSVALVRQNGDVLACETVSQFEIHAAHGGVFPELASRAHVQAILPTVQRVMATIDNDRARIRAIGVSRGPGLIGSILVGVNTATGLGLAWGVPVIGVNHLRGHLRSAALEGQTLPYPAVVLLASGGHTILSHMASAQDMQVLGQTRDDSIGECYDKVARMLGLGMPGGPAVDMAALSGVPRYPLPRPMRGAGYEFSFSGLKSSVARLLEKEPRGGGRGRGRVLCRCVSGYPTDKTGPRRRGPCAQITGDRRRGGGEPSDPGDGATPVCRTRDHRLPAGAEMVHRQRRNDRICRLGQPRDGRKTNRDHPKPAPDRLMIYLRFGGRRHRPR